MNILVTGASGLVGKSLVNMLSKEDKIENVICLYRNIPKGLSSEKIVPIKGDLDSLSEITLPLKIRNNFV